MRLKFILSLIIIITSHLSLTAKDKETTIEKINKADSIPVFINLGAVKSARYNPQLGKIPLLQNELDAKYVESKMPQEFESLMNELVKELNLKFSTNKFIASTTGNRSQIEKKMANTNPNLAVIYNFEANYAYDYKMPIRRENLGTSLPLISNRKIVGTSNVGFYKLKAGGQLKSISTAVALVYGKSFYTTSFISDANILILVKSPTTIKDKYLSMAISRTGILSEKLHKKHSKSIKKRK